MSCYYHLRRLHVHARIWCILYFCCSQHWRNCWTYQTKGHHRELVRQWRRQILVEMRQMPAGRAIMLCRNDCTNWKVWKDPASRAASLWLDGEVLLGSQHNCFAAVAGKINLSSAMGLTRSSGISKMRHKFHMTEASFRNPRCRHLQFEEQFSHEDNFERQREQKIKFPLVVRAREYCFSRRLDCRQLRRSLF